MDQEDQGEWLAPEEVVEVEDLWEVVEEVVPVQEVDVDKVTTRFYVHYYLNNKHNFYINFIKIKKYKNVFYIKFFFYNSLYNESFYNRSRVRWWSHEKKL